MRQIRSLLYMVLAAFVTLAATLFQPSGLLHRILSIVICAIFSANHALCFSSLSRSAIAATPDQAPSTIIADIPRIRVPELALPEDFQVVSQMPFSAGYREVSIISQSTGMEQIYQTNLPDQSFEIKSVEFRNTSSLDLRPLLQGEAEPATISETQKQLQTFKVYFDNQDVSQVIFSDQTTAEFRADGVVIKSKDGQILETVSLSPSISQSSPITVAATAFSRTAFAEKSNTPTLGEADCKRFAEEVYQKLTRKLESTAQALKNKTAGTKIVAHALLLAKASLNQATTRSELKSNVCKVPVRCQDQVIAGKSEIKTDLFAIAPNLRNRKVTLDYNFYVIPDQLEVLYNGQRIFHVGPTAGIASHILNLPENADYVEVKVTGNQADKRTEWNYTISCSGDLIARTDCENLPQMQNNRPSVSGWFDRERINPEPSPDGGNTGAFRRVYSKPGYSYLSATVYLPPNVGKEESNKVGVYEEIIPSASPGKDNRKDVAYVYLGGWGGKNSAGNWIGAVDAGFQHSKVHNNWSLFIKAKGLVDAKGRPIEQISPEGENTRLNPGEVEIGMEVLPQQQLTVKARNTQGNDTGWKIVTAQLPSDQGWKGQQILKRMTSLAKCHKCDPKKPNDPKDPCHKCVPEDLNSGSFISGVKWSNIRIGTSEENAQPWTDAVTGGYRNFHSEKIRIRCTEQDRDNLLSHTDSIVLK
jgi:hypothetical protein